MCVGILQHFSSQAQTPSDSFRHVLYSSRSVSPPDRLNISPNLHAAEWCKDSFPLLGDKTNVLHLSILREHGPFTTIQLPKTTPRSKTQAVMAISQAGLNPETLLGGSAVQDGSSPHSVFACSDDISHRSPQKFIFHRRLSTCQK